MAARATFWTRRGMPRRRPRGARSNRVLCAFALGDLGGVAVDGKAEPVRAYAVTGELGWREADCLLYVMEA